MRVTVVAACSMAMVLLQRRSARANKGFLAGRCLTVKGFYGRCRCVQQLVKDACSHVGSQEGLAKQLAIADVRTIRSWIAGERQPQPRFREDLRRLAGLPHDWRFVERTELANRLGVHERTVAAWQRGERPVPARWLPQLGGRHTTGVRTWRVAHGLSQAALAARLDVSVRTVSSWETHVRGISAKAHARLMALAGVEALDWWELNSFQRVRHMHGWSRAEAARQLGVSAHRFEEWESGRIVAPLWAASEIALWNSGGEPTLAVTLRVARRMTGKTVADIAVLCGVTLETVRAWERGDDRPSTHRVRKVAAAYSLSATDVSSAGHIPRPISGRQLAVWRHKQNLTQRELGRQLGVSWRSVGRWETGRGLPSPQMLLNLQSFGAPVNATGSVQDAF